MRFLFDVHISLKIAKHFSSIGFETIHVNKILQGSNSTDAEIRKFADLEGYIVVKKTLTSEIAFLYQNRQKN